MSINPKVFISHSTADKVRFIIPFAERLRKDGIDAWVDKWEILPGDSLVNKIFNEGIGQADKAIIVLSENSVTSRWVNEELDSVVVKKIEGKCRLIPIIIDNCSIPTALKHLKYVKISNLAYYENEYKEIVEQFSNKYQNRHWEHLQNLSELFTSDLRI